MYEADSGTTSSSSGTSIRQFVHRYGPALSRGTAPAMVSPLSAEAKNPGQFLERTGSKLHDGYRRIARSWLETPRLVPARRQARLNRLRNGNLNHRRPLEFEVHRIGPSPQSHDCRRAQSPLRPNGDGPLPPIPDSTESPHSCPKFTPAASSASIQTAAPMRADRLQTGTAIRTSPAAGCASIDSPARGEAARASTGRPRTSVNAAAV
jgi:hypothetical protein